jgi:hypothetical protein
VSQALAGLISQIDGAFGHRPTVARLSYPGCSILLTLRVYLRFPVHFACSLLNLVGQFAKPAGSLAYLIGQAATLGNLVLYPDQQFDVFGHDLSLKGAPPKIKRGPDRIETGHYPIEAASYSQSRKAKCRYQQEDDGDNKRETKLVSHVGQPLAVVFVSYRLGFVLKANDQPGTTPKFNGPPSSQRPQIIRQLPNFRIPWHR